MNKELIDAVENWCSENSIVIPFNMELMQVNEIPESQYESYGIPKDGFPEVNIIQNLGKGPLIPQFMYKLDKTAIDIITKVNPTLVVWMGEGSTAENFGYPRTSNEIYNYQSIHNDPRPRGNIIFHNILSHEKIIGLFIENYGPTDNCSIGLFPTKYWKVARLFGTEFGLDPLESNKTKFIDYNKDLLNKLGFKFDESYCDEYDIYRSIFEEYAKDVLNLEFDF